MLAASLKGEPLFPISFSLAHPGPEDLSNRFEEARRWIQELEAGARAAKGFGYDIVSTEINNRRIGRNSLPTSVTLLTEADALRLIGKVREAALFRSLSALTLEKLPELGPWMQSKPMRLLDHAEKWERLLDVLLWLRKNPRPEIYVRQMDLTGVDTKFIESCEGILTELSRAMTAGSGTAAGLVGPVGPFSPVGPVGPFGPVGEGRKSFEARFGFLSKPTLIRFRILDSRMHIQGLSDLTAPLSEVAALSLPVKRVFITENDINGLAFPPLDGSLVLFGLGYGVETLSAIPWLHEVEMYYWGDIDTHGFAILDRLRVAFPDCRSVLMDRETLMAHQDFWVEEPWPAKADLVRLTPEENSLFEDLMLNRFRTKVRLEQERIGFKWVKGALSAWSEGSLQG
ncbi:MAG: DUF2220 family protein [Fibrobacterota bacterium]|nr:DUF2220 family protein [Fibrobacterota bacterium]